MFVAGMGATALGGSALLASGASSRVESQRGATIRVVGDEEAYLRLVYNQEPLTVNCDGSIELVTITNQLKETIDEIVIENLTVEPADLVVNEGTLAVPDQIDVGEIGRITITVECEPGTDTTSTVSFDIIAKGIDQAVIANGHVDKRFVEVNCECARVEGCSPGFWRQPAYRNGIWTDTDTYGPSERVADVFTLAVTGTQGQGGNAVDFDELTLREALDGGGGSGVSGAQQILLRAATAGLLNSQHPEVNYPKTESQLIADVDAALATEDRERILALAADLDEVNNEECPIRLRSEEEA
ncbi:hypothetical protein SAMN06264855_11478 [Halorubrum vacuolatum]|uniref:Uncharacterized protein n=2 Tax=Halorubrum vacuolatum TaxID=63740 RepID=A0A238X871_HALVU|nr:hypothetical protein SAMN06264855_11478 [Halorubrum vacuolatum]